MRAGTNARTVPTLYVPWVIFALQLVFEPRMKQIMSITVITYCDIVFRCKCRNKGCVRVQIDRGVPPLVREINNVPWIEGAFHQRMIQSSSSRWIGVFHPLSTALILVVVNRNAATVAWGIEDPMLAPVESFGKAGSVDVPLDSGTAVADSKRQRDQFCNARVTQR